jgi:hypothetical protein
MRVRTFAFATAAAMLFACAGEQQPPPEYPLLEEPEPEVAAEEVPEPEPEPPEPPPPPVRVVAGERTPIEGKAPTLRIQRPNKNQVIRRGDVQVQVRVTNWPLEADPGQHLHLIVDNEPYMAIRDIRKPLNLNELMKEHLDQELEEGTHLIRMFPSRAAHESVKEDRPFASVVFHYRKKSDDWAFDPKAPLLTYSRPKGCNPAGKRILLDFYLTNVDELSAEGHQVRYTIGDVTGVITEWVPHYIENLPEGEHEVRLQLVDAEGEVVEGPFNDTTRTIQIGGCGDEGAEHEHEHEHEHDEAEGDDA